MTTAGAQSARNNPWEAYSDPYDKIRTPKLSPLEKIANGGKPLIVFAKSLIVDVWEGSEYATGFWATGAGHFVTMQFQEQILWRMYCKLLFAVVLVVFSIRPSVISKIKPTVFKLSHLFLFIVLTLFILVANVRPMPNNTERRKQELLVFIIITITYINIKLQESDSFSRVESLILDNVLKILQCFKCIPIDVQELTRWAQ